MRFWNWGPTTMLHTIDCVAFYFSKSLHPKAQPRGQALLYTYRYMYTYTVSNQRSGAGLKYAYTVFNLRLARAGRSFTD